MTNPVSSKRTWTKLVFWLAVVFVVTAVTLFSSELLTRSVFPHEILHSVVETAMGMISLILGSVLLQRSGILSEAPPLGAVGAGFFMAAVFFFFHAASTDERASVIFFSLVVLLSSLAFAVVWVPSANSFCIRYSRLFLIVSGILSVLTGTGIMLFHWRVFPIDIFGADAALMIQLMRVIAVPLYLTGTVWFIRRFLQTGDMENISFIAVGVLGALTALIRPVVINWSGEWWSLVLLRLLAFALLLGIVLRNFKYTMIRRQQVERELISLFNFPNRNPNPVLRINADGEILYANAAAERLIPYLTFDGNMIKTEGFEYSLPEIISAGTGIEEELVCGETVYAFDFTPIAEDNAVNIYALDVTVRQRAFEVLQQTEARLRQTVENLERSNADLEQFAYAASHDLQEPLRMVGSYVQLLQRRYGDRLDMEAKEFIAYAVDGVQRMSELIDGLLHFSRVQREHHPDSVDCICLMENVLRNMSVKLEETQVDIIIDSLPVVRADRIQLSRVFQNLISNALKFCDSEAPQIRISCRETPEEWHFVVADNGIGIEPEYAEKIFGLFKRLHGREKYSGTGIGLAVCKRIIERHNGQIWVEPRSGGGSEFHFTIRKEASA